MAPVPYSGYLDPYRPKITAWSAAGMSRLGIARRLYDEGLRAPRCWIVQPRDPETEREPQAVAIMLSIVYMEKRDALYRYVNGWADSPYPHVSRIHKRTRIAAARIARAAKYGY